VDCLNSIFFPDEFLVFMGADSGLDADLAEADEIVS